MFDQALCPRRQELILQNSPQQPKFVLELGMMKKILSHISEANEKFAAIPTEQKERMASLISNFRNQQQQLVASQRIANANVMQPPPIPQQIGRAHV